jgi:hypothetical protein
MVRRRRDRRAAQPLDRGNAARVIEVRVRIEDQANVLGLEAQRADVRVDRRGRLRQCRVEQYVPLSGRHQHGR